MGVCIAELLTNEPFKGSAVLAGHKGIDRAICRVSVFDCPYHPDILAGGIVEKGDFFISCLEQFEPDTSELLAFLNCLADYECAGLLVVPTGRVNNLNEPAISLCNQRNLPILLLQQSIPYAVIMAEINKFVTVDNVNILNRLKLDKIKYGNLPAEEQVQLLKSINPLMEENIRTIFVQGMFQSPIAAFELRKKYMNAKNDLLVTGDQLIFLLSDRDIKQLKNRSNATSSHLKNYLVDYHIGFSQIHPLQDICNVLNEGEKALQAAITLQIAQQTYNPMLSLNLLLALHSRQETRDFYKAYLAAISDRVSSDVLPEILNTVDAYVANAGDYKKTAQEINQHENTIRYRVNRVKAALGMEDNNIQFHETIAIACKLRILLDGK